MGLADDAQNTAEELKEQAEEAVGAAAGNDDLERDGKAEEVEADVKQKVSEAADKIQGGDNDITSEPFV